MKANVVLKPDRQGRVTLPKVLRGAGLVSYEIRPDGSVLFFPVRAVREYPNMSDLPETNELPASMRDSLDRAVAAEEKGSYHRDEPRRGRKRTKS